MVVGDQPLGEDPVLLEERERPGGEGGDRRRAAIREQLRIAEARVIVDDRVREVVA